MWAKVFPVAVLRRADHPFWAAASESGLPLTVYRPEQLQEIGEVAAMNPGLTLVIDHAAALLDGDPRVAFSVAPALAGLSRHPNVVIKASGLPQATGEAFPFVLAQRRLLEVVEQFGAERVMWGSNFTGSRGVEGYSELVEYARDAVSGLSDADRHAVLCGTAARVFGLPSP